MGWGGGREEPEVEEDGTVFRLYCMRKESMLNKREINTKIKMNFLQTASYHALTYEREIENLACKNLVLPLSSWWRAGVSPLQADCLSIKWLGMFPLKG